MFYFYHRNDVMSDVMSDVSMLCYDVSPFLWLIWIRAGTGVRRLELSAEGWTGLGWE